jgi:hypothetical protein
MNYLQLVQTAQRILRATSDKLGAAPTTVVGQQGFNDELVFFIKQAWLDIQNSNTRWRFLWKEGTLTLPENADTITPFAISDFATLINADSDGRGRFITMLVDGPDSETTIRFVPYAAFQQSYLTRGVRGPGQPANFTVLPDERLRFDLIADRPYTIKINYNRTPQELVDNLDVPIVAERYHMAIVWWAIARYYCTTRDGAEKFRQKAAAEMAREMQKLNNEQVADPIIFEV